MSVLATRHSWPVVADDQYDGSRIPSSFAIDPTKPSKGFGENTLWIITESDRSVTTFLLPSEY